MKSIAISAQWFLAWNGGIDFLKNVVQGLIANNDNQYFILIPQRELPRKNMLYKALRLVIRNIPYFLLKDQDAERHFSEFKNRVSIVHYRRNSLTSTINRYAVDLILPCVYPPNTSIQCQWIGYLPDCQHRYLGHLFTRDEIKQRDRDYQQMVDTQKTILVNSVDAKNDLVDIYGAQPDQIYNLPFCPTVNLDWLENNEDVLKVYSLPATYFMISNQFWKHKDHTTAFKALALLQNQDTHIVCSGKMDDYRDLAYVDKLIEEVRQLGIEERIHFLGFIPKLDQIEILKKSLAILQPTLFEGGPGGGCVYDAISLGVPCILSDIDINKEVIGPNTFYFKAGKADDLAETIEHFLSLDIKKPSVANLRQAHKKNLALRAGSLNQLVSETLK